MPLTTEVRVEGVRDATQELIEFFRAFREGRQDVQTINAAMRETAAPIYGMRRSLMLLRTEMRANYAYWFETARVLRDIGRIGRNITQMWTAYTVSQIRVAQAQRGVAEATKTVAELQDRYNRYLEVFGENSVFTKRAYEELQEAQERLKMEQEELNRALEQQKIGWIGIGLQMGDIVAAIPLTIYHLKMLKYELAGIGGLKGALSGVAGALGAIAAIISFGLLYREYVAKPAEERAKKIYGEQWKKMHPMQRRMLKQLEQARKQQEITGDIGQQIISGLQWIGEQLANLFREAFGFQYGGIVPATGLYRLHAGELIVPANKVVETTTPKTVNIRVTNYFGAITSEIDLETAGEKIADKIMVRLAEKW